MGKLGATATTGIVVAYEAWYTISSIIKQQRVHAMLPGNFAILDLSTPDLAIILLIFLLLFGSKRLPELSRSLGASARELKKGFSDIQEAHGELRDQVKQVTNVTATVPEERRTV
jgi:TatA/E family protein of Tat protein translocase